MNAWGREECVNGFCPLGDAPAETTFLATGVEVEGEGAVVFLTLELGSFLCSHI